MRYILGVGGSSDSPAYAAMTAPRTFQPSFPAQTRLAPIQKSRPLITATGSKMAGDTTIGATEGEDTIMNFLLI